MEAQNSKVYLDRLQKAVNKYYHLDTCLGLEFCRLAVEFIDKYQLEAPYDNKKLLARIDKLWREFGLNPIDRDDWKEFIYERVSFLFKAVKKSKLELSADQEDQLRRVVSDPDALWDISRDRVVGIRHLVRAYALASACINDRFAAIVPMGFEKEVDSLLDTYVPIVFTGILTQGLAKDQVFYHMCSTELVDQIFSQGLKGSLDDSASFGAGVIYTYDQFEKFKPWNPEKFTVLKIRYSGPYLKAYWRQDTEEEHFGECMLYPAFVTSFQKMDTPWSVPNPKWDSRVHEVQSNLFK